MSTIQTIDLSYAVLMFANVLTSSVLYIPIVTPPVPVNSNTSVVNLVPPSAGTKEISKVPGPFITKSRARY